MKTIGERIRWARLRAKPRITQRQIAEHLGISSPSVTEWESGSSSPTSDKIPALAQLLGVDPLWLAFNVGMPDPERSGDFLQMTTLPGGNVPVIDPMMAANDLAAAIGSTTEYAPCIVPDTGNYYYLRLISDANAPTYPIGTLVLCDRDGEVIPGKMVFASITDGRTRKPFFGQYREARGADGRLVKLIAPLNPIWAEAILNENHDQILGVEKALIITK